MSEKKMTMLDIAKMAGVSKTTVSFYFNNRQDKMSKETYEKIKSVVERTGYYPNVVARRLNYSKTGLLGVVIGDITNNFSNQIVKGIENYAHEKGYQLIVSSSEFDFQNETKILNRMLTMGVDGLIIQPTVHFEPRVYEEKLPLVCFDSPNEGSSNWVKTNHYEAMLDACEHMFQKGYEKYVLITADPTVLRTRLERYQGFVDAMKAHQKPHEIFQESTQSQTEDIAKKIHRIVQENQSTCFIVCSCWLLTKVYLALNPYKDLMPKQIGLLGFDSLEWTNFSHPSISTIVQPAYDEGYTAAKILIDQIDGKFEEPPNQILKCTLNELESTNK